jgi:hypothetical protein
MNSTIVEQSENLKSALLDLFKSKNAPVPQKTTRLERHHGLSLTEYDVRAQLIEIEQKKAEKAATQQEKREKAEENKAMRAKSKAEAAAKKASKALPVTTRKKVRTNKSISSSFPDAQPLMSQSNEHDSPAIKQCDKCSSCFGENPTMTWLACERCANWRCANCLPKSVKVTAEFFCSLKCKKQH